MMFETEGTYLLDFNFITFTFDIDIVRDIVMQVTSCKIAKTKNEYLGNLISREVPFERIEFIITR